MTVVAQGYELKDKEYLELYKLQIDRSMRTEIWLWLVIGIAAFIGLLSCMLFCCICRSKRNSNHDDDGVEFRSDALVHDND